MSGSAAPPQLTVSSNGVGVVPDVLLNTYCQAACVVVNLRAFVGLSNMTVMTVGQITPGDGGAQAYYYDPTSIADDDGLTIIQPYGIVIGRWLSLGFGQRSSPPVGSVVMYRSPFDSAWTVVTETGTPLNIAGTTTQGLQEAINYGFNNGVPVFIMGGGIQTPVAGGVDYASIICTTPLTFPTCNASSLEAYGVTLFLSPTNPSADGMTFDTIDLLNFKWRGQIVYSGTGAAIRLLPQTDNGEGFIGATSSLFDISTIVCADGSTHLPHFGQGLCFRVSPQNGVVINNRFLIGEMNAGLVGFQVDSPTGSFTFNLNEIDCPAVHAQSSACVAVGTSIATNLIYGNQWRLNLTPNGVSSEGIETWGQRDTFTVNIQGGNVGIILNTSASRNSFIIANNTATTPVIDSSDTQDNAGVNDDWYPAASVNLAGTNQTGVPDATPTRVNFFIGPYNNGGGWNNGTFRWTPGRIGIATISARVGWDTMTDAASLDVKIYRNGSEVLQSPMSSSGTAGTGAQGAFITADVAVTSTTDYFEIWAEQNSGGPLDISGGTTATWATLRMVRS